MDSGTIQDNENKSKLSNKLITGLFLASVLLMASLVSYPHQLAYGHDSAWHDFCFEETTAAFDFLVDLVPWAFPISKLITALVAWVSGVALVTVFCRPQLVPPEPVSDTIECNDIQMVDGRLVGGFKGNTTDGFFHDGDTQRGQVNTAGVVEDSLTGPGRNYPKGIFVYNFFDASGDRTGLGVIHEIKPGFILAHLFIVFTLSTLVPFVGFILAAIASVFNYKFFMDLTDDEGGHVAHPTKGIRELTTEKSSDSFFPLGANTLEFKATDKLGYKDEATVKFNVVDNGYPDIDFESNPVTIEANSHFGFSANSATLGNFKKVTGIDDCDPNPQITYKGEKFYPLQLIGGNKNATWQVKEHVKEIKNWDFTPQSQSRFYQILADTVGEVVVDTVIVGGIEVTEASIKEGGKKILEDEGWSHLAFLAKYDKMVKDQNIKIQENKFEIKRLKHDILIPDNEAAAKKLNALEAKDTKLNKDLDKMTNGPDVKGALGGKALGLAIAAASTLFFGKSGSENAKIDAGSISVERNQTVIVVDTLPPDILVLDHKAIEVPVNATIASDVTISTPLVFDVADPFPTLTHNATGVFAESEGSSIVEDFPLGLTKIAWNATDLSGNQSPFVMQFVNVKTVGSNLNSTAFDKTVPLSFTDFPVDITLEAANPDDDPLTFLIAENPENGVILSPIEAVFQNKFQLKGTVSRLQGISVDSNELVFLTDSENDRILTLDSNGVLNVAFNTTLTSKHPDAISLFDSDRFLISDWDNQTIAETNSDGDLLDKIDLSSLFAINPPILSHPEFLDKHDKKIYITDSETGSLVIIENDETFANPIKLENPRGLAINGDSLYVSDSGNDRVIQFVDESFTNQFGELGSDNGQFSNTAGLSTNGISLFVADTNNHRIQVFDLLGSYLSTIGTGVKGNGTNQFSFPQDVTTNSTHIFISDTDNHRIQIFNGSGTYLQTLGSGIEGSGTDQFSFPSGLATNSTHIFVSDTNNHRIQIFNQTLELVKSIGSGTSSSSDGDFDFPLGIFNNGTNIFVADSGNKRIQIFDSQGQFALKFGSPALLKEPSDVVTNSFSEIYVSDSDGNKIQIFDSQGTKVGTIDSKISKGVSKQTTSIPLFVFDLQADSLDFDSNGDLLVSDWNKKRIVKFLLDGGEISEQDLSSLFADIPIIDPHNIAIDSADSIYITDKSNQKIHVIKKDWQYDTSINLNGTSIKPDGISIDDSDNIFVSDWTASSERIVQIDIDGNLVAPPFELEGVFSNPQDIAFNGTHYWIVDDLLGPENDKKIIQFKVTKGIEKTFDISSNNVATIGLSFKSNFDNRNILFTNQTSGKIFDLDVQTEGVSEFADVGGNPDLIGITKNTKQSRFLGEFVGSNEGNLEKPTGITIGPDLNFYVSSTADNSIKRFDGNTGEYLGDFVNPDDLEEVDSLSYPRDLIFGPDTNLYVAIFETDSVKKFNGTTGAYLGDFVTPALGGLDEPVGLTFHPFSGDLLVGSSKNNNILRFNGTDGSFIDYFVPSSENGDLTNPQSLSIGPSPNHNLFVASRGTDVILEFDILNGQFIKNFTSPDNLSKPTGLAFDYVKGFLYSTSQGDLLDEIIKFNATTGEMIGQISNGEVSRPQGIVVSLNSDVFTPGYTDNAVFRYGISPSSIFLGDWSNNDHEIIGLNSTGHQIPMIGFNQSAVNSELKKPEFMATDSLGDIWVTDTTFGNKGQLVQFDGGVGSLKQTLDLSDIPLVPIVSTMNTTLSNGTIITIDSEGNVVNNDAPPTISVIPGGLTIDSFDNFYVADWKNNRIVKLDFTGTFLDIFKLNGTINTPQDILLEEIDGQTKIYVSEKKSGELLKIDTDEILQEIDLGSEHEIVKGITNFDESIFFTSTSLGNGGKIFEVNQTGFILPVSEIVIEPMGVAVAGPDSIYLSDWKDERILEINSLGQKEAVYDLSFTNFLDNQKLRDIEVQEETGYVEFWLADSRKAEIQKVNMSSNTIESQESVADKFVFISSLAVDSDDNFYVTSTENSTFNKFTERGSLLEEIGVDEDRILIDVSAQKIINSIFVFLSLGNPSEIQKFNSTLNLNNTLSINGQVTSIASSKNGDIFVGHPNNTISKFSEIFVKQPSLTINQPASISDIVIDHDNNLFATDKALHRIHKFNLTSGDYVGWLGKCDVDIGAGCDLNDQHTKGFTVMANNTGTTSGSDFSQFFEPSDITVDRTGNIFVADIQIKEDFNSPRIQKFSNTGYFIENFLSNSSNTMIKGNFNNTQSIAIGSNFFYVADVEKLHFFDVNPFSPISLNQTSKITSSNVTYRSNPEFPIQPAFPSPANNIGFDNFQYKVTDGFNESNVGLVNVTVASPDIDRDGIFFNVDTNHNVTSVTFLDDSNPNQITNGTIVDYGHQVITIQDSRDPEKGVFIQADVTPIVNVNPEFGVIRACDDSIEIHLNPGNRLNLDCGNGGEVESIRGNIEVIFFDEFGRNATSKIGVGNSLHFSPLNFAFITSDENNNVMSTTMNFNSKSETFSVEPDQEVVVDTAPPGLDQDTCSKPIILEAEIIQGVDSTDDTTTHHFLKINEFLDLTIEDVDNGSPKTTEGKILTTTNNYTSTNQNILPIGTTTVLFESIDDTGNKGECTSTITVQDTISPSITFLEDIKTVYTPPHDDVAIVNFDTGTTRDLPKELSQPQNHVDRILSGDNHKPQCIMPPGSTFVLGSNPIGCIANDNSLNSRPGRSNFTINVVSGTSEVFINSLNAYDKESPSGLSSNDVIRVEFSQSTNKPTAVGKSDIDNIFEFTQGDGTTPVSLGHNYSGRYITPSLLEIKLNDPTGANFTISDTRFKIKPDSGLENAAGTFGTSLTTSPKMMGSFNFTAPPLITAFLADDSDLKNIFEEGDDPLDDIRYSLNDTLTIRFSDPTNKPGGATVLEKEVIDSIFIFNGSSGDQVYPGDDYSGEWINALTFLITINELNTLLPNDPVPGETTVTVRDSANLKDKTQTSLNSQSTSHPLLGSFGPFNIVKKIEPEGTATTSLPSGLIVEMTFPNGTDSVSIGRSTENGSDGKDEFIFLGHTIEIKAAEDDACVNGCDLEFTFTTEDLAQHGLGIHDLRIFHDADDNGIFENNEILIPTITRPNDNGPFTAKVTVFSNSLMGIGEKIQSSGGGGGDDTSPIIQKASMGGGGSIIPLDEIHFENNVEKSIISVGEEFILKVTLYENSGPDALQHISLYTDLHGFEREVHHSDAYLRYDKGIGTETYDPQNLFGETDISISQNNSNLDIEFKLIFDQPMEESDIIVRAWDTKRNSVDIRFTNAIEVIPSEQGVIDLEDGIFIDKDTFEKWAGYSEGSILDSEFLENLGIDGKLIPEWYKRIVVKWVYEEVISIEEFVNALKFFEKQGLLN